MAPLSKKPHHKRKRSFPEFKPCNASKGPKSNSKVPKQGLPSSFVVQEEEPEFPRGGGSILSREEEVEACVETEKEFDREQGLTHRIKNKLKMNKKVPGNEFQAAEDQWESLFRQGITGKLTRLTNRITWKIDEEKKRISLGMKKSYVEDAKNEVPGSSPAMNCTLTSSMHDDLSCTQNINDPQDDGATTILSQAESRALVLPLQVSLDDSEDTHMESVVYANRDNANEIMEIEKKKNRHTKKKEKQERELEISASEERRLQNDMPQTIDDFEKLVRSSPNSSFFWIKYMEFMLGQADVEKARAIAERALKTILIQEEGERLNIWVAYFNYENAYGTSPEEDVERLFKRAIQTCDSKKLHLALLGMYERTEQHKLADTLLDKMTKKFKKSCKVWLCRVQHFLKQEIDGIQSVISRGLLSLPTKKHIKFISHTAILEFKCGAADMGRSMFEGVLREHPKRTDLWSIYLDQEIRQEDQEIIRGLFERATCLSLSAKKMKFLFKKYHAYEESQGDKDRVEYVKQKALEYLEASC